MTVRDFLKPPVYEDLEVNRVANLMYLILLYNGAFILLLLLVFIILGITSARQISPILVSLFTYGVFYTILKKGYVKASAYLFVIVSFLVITVVILLYGGVTSPHLFLYFVTVFIASAVMEVRHAILIYGLVMAASIGMYLAEKSGVMPFSYISILETTPLIILGSNLVIMVSIIYLSNRNFRQTLKLYKAELETRRRTEEEIRRLNIELEQRVQLRTAKLEEAVKDLESFSYSISHDLRAPLRAISGFVKIILEDASTIRDKESSYLMRIKGATQKMDSMITGLLEISRITRENLTFEPVNLSAAAKEIVDDLPAREAREAVEITIAEDIVALGDERLLRMVLLNLIQNAWKFTKNCEVSRIEFSSMEKDGEKVYFVKDNGAGFDPAYADKLFTPFQRLHSETEFKGYGIGLATCKKVIQRHGGEIWVEAEAGKGATFYFTLPG